MQEAKPRLHPKPAVALYPVIGGTMKVYEGEGLKVTFSASEGNERPIRVEATTLETEEAKQVGGHAPNAFRMFEVVDHPSPERTFFKRRLGNGLYHQITVFGTLGDMGSRCVIELTDDADDMGVDARSSLRTMRPPPGAGDDQDASGALTAPPPSGAEYPPAEAARPKEGGDGDEESSS